MPRRVREKDLRERAAGLAWESNYASTNACLSSTGKPGQGPRLLADGKLGAGRSVERVSVRVRNRFGKGNQCVAGRGLRVQRRRLQGADRQAVTDALVVAGAACRAVVVGARANRGRATGGDGRMVGRKQPVRAEVHAHLEQQEESQCANQGGTPQPGHERMPIYHGTEEGAKTPATMPLRGFSRAMRAEARTTGAPWKSGRDRSAPRTAWCPRTYRASPRRTRRRRTCRWPWRCRSRPSCPSCRPRASSS